MPGIKTSKMEHVWEMTPLTTRPASRDRSYSHVWQGKDGRRRSKRNGRGDLEKPARAVGMKDRKCDRGVERPPPHLRGPFELAQGPLRVQNSSEVVVSASEGASGVVKGRCAAGMGRA